MSDDNQWPPTRHTPRTRRDVIEEVICVALFAAFVAIMLLWTRPPRALGADAASTVRVWRTELQAGDPNRDWSYLWRRDASDKRLQPIELVAGERVIATVDAAVGWPREWYEEFHHASFRVPADCPAGVYEIRCNGTLTGQRVTVAAELRRQPAVTLLAPGENDAERLEQAASTGNVTLLPGEYRIHRPVHLPAGCTLRGYGAIIRRSREIPGYRFAMFAAVDRLTFVGLTFAPLDYVLFADSRAGEGIVLTGCTITNGQLGHWNHPANLLVDRCTFDRASAGSVQTGMFSGCRWRGLCHVNHAFLAERGERLAVLDAQFDATDRGLVLRSGWGTHSECLYAGIEWRGIGQVPNGNELATCEGKPGATGVNRCLFMRLRASQCDGQINLWDAPASDNLFWGGSLDGVTIQLSGLSAQRGNIFRDIELRGGGVVMGPLATGNVFERVASVGWRPSKVNQAHAEARWYRVDGAVFSAEGPDAASNKCDGCTVVGSQAALIGRGVSWR